MENPLQNDPPADTGHSHSDGRLTFFREFLRQPRQIGSVIPSSRYLERRIIDAASVPSAKMIVELGSGTGGTTRAILRAMSADAVLLSVELNPRFHHMVRQIHDDRLIPHLGSAGDLNEILSLHGLPAPEAIISCIPFSTMKNHQGAKICEAVTQLLAPGGAFVAFAYQSSPRVAMLCRPFLGKEKITLELLNIPPARVYRWKKMVL
uniref:Phospholipid N-methyltransferase n=1 Tax=Candidatus Kentrum sp. DK TaxID=2126562 RepID=A0A450T033_9GAMM|nr:MAG: Phospholipid N-methyltransferase [Candidatus Kentron sp. DK]VFJ59874.1 MAG: Phospholipid N-methyltransferase [Candidatus Kentron sp. DK]